MKMENLVINEFGEFDRNASILGSLKKKEAAERRKKLLENLKKKEAEKRSF